jgi:hypothetical protein
MSEEEKKEFLIFNQQRKKESLGRGSVGWAKSSGVCGEVNLFLLVK